MTEQDKNRRCGFVALIGFAVLYLLLRVTRSPFGHVLVAIRENQQRATFQGYDVDRYRFGAFVLSATVTGLGGALLGFLQLPVPVSQRFIVQGDLAHLLAHQAEPDAERGERDAGDRKQEGDADRKGVRIIAGALRPAAGNEAIGTAERDGEDHQGAEREGDPGMTAAETTEAKFDPESRSHRQ